MHPRARLDYAGSVKGSTADDPDSMAEDEIKEIRKLIV
jgi:hypothetical protein